MKRKKENITMINKGTENESAMLIELTEEELESMCGGYSSDFQPFEAIFHASGDINTQFDGYATLTVLPLN
jgi:hypothetical protein